MNPTFDERAVLLKTYIDWEYNDAVSQLRQSLEASFGVETDLQALDDVRERFLAEDERLMKLRDPEAEWPDPLVQRLAAQEVQNVEINGSLNPGEVQAEVDELTMFLQLLDKVGWPPPDDDDEKGGDEEGEK